MIFLPSFTALLIGALYRLFLRLDPHRYRRNRLRRYVRLGKGRGIPGPELIGWLQWYKAAVAANLAKDPGELDERIQEHLRHSFGKEQ